MLPPTVENLSAYADFYHTAQLLEAARNRVLNGCKTLDRARVTPDQEAEIARLTWQIYNKMFSDGKQTIEEVRRRLLAATQAHHDGNAAEKKLQMEMAAKWCQALTKTSRNMMKVVCVLSDMMTKHTPNNESNITPPVDASKRVDMATFVTTLGDLWKMITA